MNSVRHKPISSYIRRLPKKQRLALYTAEFCLLMFLGWSLTFYA